MGDPNDTERFFDDLVTTPSRPALGAARGSIRFDLQEGKRVQHWRVVLGNRKVTVDQSDDAADCVVLAERAAFDEVASGRVNALAALLRGAVQVTGDPSPLVRFQRLFPAGERRPIAAGARAVGKRRS